MTKWESTALSLKKEKEKKANYDYYSDDNDDEYDQNSLFMYLIRKTRDLSFLKRYLTSYSSITLNVNMLNFEHDKMLNTLIPQMHKKPKRFYSRI